MADLQRAVVSCAFDENAIAALSLWLDRQGLLTTRYVPWRRLEESAQRIIARTPVRPAAVRAYNQRLVARQRRRSLPADLPTSATSEILRILGGKFRSPASHTMGNYLWKAAFDRATAKIPPTRCDLLIGMPGSCLKTFRRASAALTLFHATDSHPRFRNAALERHYDRCFAAAETYPQRLVERIEEELAVANRVLVPSNLVRSQMTANGVPAEKIITVPYGVDTSRFQYRPDRATEATSETASPGRARPRVIYVGQVSLSKGLPFLIQAVRGLPLDLSIIGNVFDRRVVQDLPDNVEVLGALAPEALARRYWEATAFVLPTLHDAYGLVVLEALAAGLPVITTTAAGAAQLLDDRHMIVEPGSAKELRSALLSLTRLSAEERLTIAESANAIELPDGSFMKCDWDSYAAQVMTHVSQALAETAGRA